MVKLPRIDISKLDMPQDLFDDSDLGFKESPAHIINLYENWSEILNLVEIQEERPLKGAVFQKRVDVLNKAAIVLLVASWEAFVEDLAKNAFDHLIENAESPTVFPKKVLALSVKDIHENQDRTKVWNLAGDGWKDVLKAHRKKVVDQHIGRLNTPRAKQVDSLFLDIIGFKKMSSLWKWRGMPHKTALNKLEALINLRGEIAHRVRSKRKVRKIDIINYARFISRISVIMSNHVGVFVHRCTNQPTWKLLRIGETYR